MNLNLTPEQRAALEQFADYADGWQSKTVSVLLTEYLLANAAPPTTAEPAYDEAALVRWLTTRSKWPECDNCKNGRIVDGTCDCCGVQNKRGDAVSRNDSHTHKSAEPSHTPPLPDAPSEPLRLRVGAWYERRDGRVVQIVNYYPDGLIPYECNDNYRNYEDGAYSRVLRNHHMDLIREVPPPVAEPEASDNESARHMQSDLPPSPRLTELITKAQCRVMTPEELEAQRQGYAKSMVGTEERATTTDQPAPPRFKVGDRVRICCDPDSGDVFNGKLGTVEVFATDHHRNPYRVGFNDHQWGWYNGDQLKLAPEAPRTITVYDGAAFVPLRDAPSNFKPFYLRRIESSWAAVCEGVIDDYRNDIDNDLNTLIQWQYYTPDPARDQHPVGSEWVDEDSHACYLNKRWNDKLNSTEYALTYTGWSAAQGVKEYNHGWHADIADATRGARRADGAEIEL